MQRLLRSLDVKPQVDSYFLKRTATGGLLSILSLVLSLFVAVTIVHLQSKIPSSLEIDTSLYPIETLTVEATFPNVLCEFIKVSGSTIGGESVNVELMNGKILTSEDINHINRRLNEKNYNCYFPLAESTMYRSRMLCDSCERILSVYSRLGYKITKLLPRLDQCGNYSVFDYVNRMKSSQCKKQWSFHPPNVKFELSIDASGIFPFLSSDDFESDSLLSLVDVTPSSLSIAANGHAPKLLSFPSTALNASSWDVDVTMIPIGSSKNRDYEAVSRVSRLSFDGIRGESTPVLRVVVNQSGLMRSEEGMEWVKTGVWVVTGVGCVMATMELMDRLVEKVERKTKTKKSRFDNGLHAN